MYRKPVIMILSVMVVLSMTAAVATAREPVKITDPDGQKIVQGFLKHVASVPNTLSVDKCKAMAETEPEGICWKMSPYLSMTLTAYELTGDAKYLDIFVQSFDNLRAALTKGPDGFLGWYGKPLKTFVNPEKPDQKVDVQLTSFSIVTDIANFVELVDQSPELKTRYAKQRAEYLDLAENHLIKKWEARGNYVDLGKHGAIYRTHFGLAPVKGNLTQPHNKHAKIIGAMLAMYRVTGNDEYMQKAVKLGTRFKNSQTLKDGAYAWNYWDPAGEWDVKPGAPTAWKHWIGAEHTSGYYASTLAQAVTLYHHGVVFTKQDIDRFVKTQTEKAWNGSIESPEWFRVDRSKGQQSGAYMAASLAPFNAKIAEYCYEGPRLKDRVDNAGHGWQGGPVADGFIRGKYITMPAAKDGKPIYAQYGQKFAAKQENRQFLESLKVEVTGEGYSAPRSPQAMKDMPKDPGHK